MVAKQKKNERFRLYYSYRSTYYIGLHSIQLTPYVCLFIFMLIRFCIHALLIFFSHEFLYFSFLVSLSLYLIFFMFVFMHLFVYSADWCPRVSSGGFVLFFFFLGTFFGLRLGVSFSLSIPPPPSLRIMRINVRTRGGYRLLYTKLN